MAPEHIPNVVYDVGDILMFMLFLAAYLLTAPTLMGIIVIALLTADMITAQYIIVAAVAGAVVGGDRACHLHHALLHRHHLGPDAGL